MPEISGEVIHAASEIVVVSALLLGSELVKRFARGKPKRHAPMEAVHAQDVRINAALDAALYLTGASRVYLSLYRNGAYFDAGNPMMRKVRTHERAAAGFALLSEKYREIVTGLIPDEFALVAADGHSFTLVSSLSHGYLKSMCQGDGSVAIARVAIRRGQSIVGFVGADYDAAAVPARIDELEKSAGIISLELATNAEKP